MTQLAAHGIGVTLPTGWEGRVFRRPGAGEVATAQADGPAAPAGESTHAVLHASTIALPPGVGDFASGAVEQLGPDDALLVLFEYDPSSATQPLFSATGIPKSLAADEFSPNVLQRQIRGQAGVQKFFHDQDRAFCLYVVLGAFTNRLRLVPMVNDVLATLTIDSIGASSAPTTTAPGVPETTAPSTSPPPSTTVAPTEPPSTTEPPTTTSVP